MKNKFLAILVLVPLMSNAHLGHLHNPTEIFFNPSQWLNHQVFIIGMAVVFAIMIRKVMKLYFPNVYKVMIRKIRSNNQSLFKKVKLNKQ
jgi:hypothetical protein